MAVTLRQLFTYIAGPSATVTKPKLEAFVEEAGVGNSFFLPKASLAADAFMKKFDDGSGQVGWEAFRKQGMALVPPGLLSQVDTTRVAAEVDQRWKQIDPQGKGAVSLNTLSCFIEAQLVAKGQSFAGTKAEAGAQVLMHALDENGDNLLQKAELQGFLVDVVNETKRGTSSGS